MIITDKIIQAQIIEIEKVINWLELYEDWRDFQKNGRIFIEQLESITPGTEYNGVHDLMFIKIKLWVHEFRINFKV